MRTAILCICTGNYIVFFENFYRTSLINLLPNHDKEYFVFTDGNISRFESDKVHKIEQTKLGWPFDTLFRFRMFHRIDNLLKDFDYIFFFNINLLFVTKIQDSEILPDQLAKIVVVQHPLFVNYKPNELEYERNPKSTAYIPKDEGRILVQGALNGGIGTEYRRLICELNENVDIDLKNNIIAVWHDESHLNRYIIDKSPKVLHPGFLYPEGFDLPFDIRIIGLDKKNYGGHQLLRGINTEKALNEKIMDMIKGCSFNIFR